MQAAAPPPLSVTVNDVCMSDMSPRSHRHGPRHGARQARQRTVTAMGISCECQCQGARCTAQDTRTGDAGRTSSHGPGPRLQCSGERHSAHVSAPLCATAKIGDGCHGANAVTGNTQRAELLDSAPLPVPGTDTARGTIPQKCTATGRFTVCAHTVPHCCYFALLF